MRNLFFVLLAVLFIGCTGQSNQNVTEKVDELIAKDQYTQALELLEDANPEETEADLATLREKTHLNYGLYLEYRGPEESSMRERMTSALEQYIKVLDINPQNGKARTEIKQIMGIYQTMPNRTPGEEIMAGLREHGFDY